MASASDQPGGGDGRFAANGKSLTGEEGDDDFPVRRGEPPGIELPVDRHRQPG